MVLTQQALHPVRRQYVLKLDRDADPVAGKWGGRVENLATGRVFEFVDVASLLEGLARELEAGETSGIHGTAHED